MNKKGIVDRVFRLRPYHPEHTNFSQPAEGSVAAASQEKHLRKSRKDSPLQQKNGYGIQHSSSLREASDHSNDF